MSDCTFQLDSATGRWRCSQCGDVYPLPLAVAPRQNCPKAPDAREASRQTITREAERLVSEGRAVRTLEQVHSTLAVCFGGCDMLRDGVCEKRGSPCKRWQRWLETIVLCGCDMAKPQ